MTTTITSNGGKYNESEAEAPLASREDLNEESVPMTKFEEDITQSPKLNRQFLYIAACVVNLASFVCGTSFGWTSPEIPKLKSTNTDNNPLSTPLTPSEESWIGSLLPVGAAIGPFAAGYAVDKLGRKNTILISTLFFIVAFPLCAIGTEVLYFNIARFLMGLGVGGLFTVVPMYIGEISDNETRGSMGSLMQLFITVGLLFSFGVGPYVSIKMLNIVCVVFPIVFIVLFYMFVPETPYYLLIKSDRSGARRALAKFRGVQPDQVEDELMDIYQNVTESQNNKASFMDIFESKQLTKALMLSVGLVTIQQFSGINIVLFFAQDIFTAAGSTIPADISTIIIGIVQVAASALTPVIVEKKGTRFLLMLSAIGMAASLGLLSFFFFLKETKSSVVDSIAILPVLSLVVYIITYCLGFGPLPWAVMGQLFPGNIKSVASTVTASGCWLLGFLITKYFSLLTDLVGMSGSFGFFAVCCVAGLVFVFKFLPETSGKSLAEIQELLAQ